MDTPLKKQKRSTLDCGYTDTPATQILISSLSSFLPCALPLCLVGPPASGKTALLRRLAQIHGTEVTSVYVDSSIDSKSLIGAYVCTEVPGEFQWRPGVLTSAVEAGAWIVFEQLQDVPMEILALLVDLAQTRWLHLPQKARKIKAPAGFRLMATACMSPGHKLFDFIHDKWVTVQVDELPGADFQQIGVALSPLIAEPSLLQLLWKVFQDLKSVPGRALYLRDWLKFCKRVDTLVKGLYGVEGIRNAYVTEKLKELVCYEAFEVLGTGRYPACLPVLAETIGVSAFQKHYTETRPNCSNNKDTLSIGRAQPMIVVSLKSSLVYTAYTLRLLERLSIGLFHAESLLLVGETGCGKTALVQHLAKLRGIKLHVHNLSQMSDPVDLIGGFKPVDVKFLLEPIIEQFLSLFPSFLSAAANQKFLDQVRAAYSARKIDQLLQYLKETFDLIFSRVSKSPGKYDSLKLASLQSLQERVHLIEKQQGTFAFQFVEGALVQALKRGDWLLLEEINLAGEDVLERLHMVLEGGSVTLIEKGETVQVPRNDEFRLFGCMNPGRQAGKKDLALPIRLKFTEISVPEMSQRSDITEIVSAGLTGFASQTTVESVVDLYQEAREAAENGTLEDGRGRPPQFSLRTLCRSLEYARTAAGLYSFPVALYNGLLVYFFSQLSSASVKVLEGKLSRLRPVAVRIPRQPGPNFICVEGFWIEAGSLTCVNSPQFILTPSTSRNLKALARCLVTNSAILLEGPTSAGKTSLVEYLSKVTGHRFIRINNHQHTDVDEYIGSYVSDSSGKLVFKEGILVEALRNGYYVVLDELNLAPSEVLEALNRLLDDNHELYIAETQTTVTPHPHFRLFATQNPTAGYAGRKELSKAFRNRFIEMHIGALPDEEIEQILAQRGKLAPSFAKVLVQVMRSLQMRRTSSHAFAGREGFITMRDLLKVASKGPSSYEELGYAAFVVLGERLRNTEEKRVLVDVLQTYIKNLDLDMSRYYGHYCSTPEFRKDAISLEETLRENPPQGLSCFTWNKNMRRLYTLLDLALKANEPVLLVGETGCGKTTICQVLAALRNRHLRTINCHQHSETADFLGGLRPIRSRSNLAKSVLLSLKEIASTFPDLEAVLKLGDMSPEEKLIQVKSIQGLPETVRTEIQKMDKVFEWVNGPLIECMREGNVLLIDEISLADESVLERLNSVLEPERRLLVPEKGGEWSEELSAVQGFQLLATMNPGGDYGKKELSPALRNRFTEIWVCVDSEDMREVISQRVPGSAVDAIIAFTEWYNTWSRVPISLRDVTCWADFVHQNQSVLPLGEALSHGAYFTFLDSMTDLNGKNRSEEYLKTLIPMDSSSSCSPDVIDDENRFGLTPFCIPRTGKQPIKYSFSGPTVSRNLFRLLRALQLSKPVLLEGSPGVGKTSLIESLAQYTGKQYCRINLSEETDLMDLLGSDLPVGDSFEWSDGALLSAMKNGHWVILDELNLCPQPVIEGLNAILDHRGVVFLPDLGREVKCAPGFRIFAAQNPLSQGGGRKGLPKSFLNRFSRIFVEQLTDLDYQLITDALFQKSEFDTEKMVRFNGEVGKKQEMAKLWEFNLRDILRWRSGASPELLYYYRMRDVGKRAEIQSLYMKEFGQLLPISALPYIRFTPSAIYIGKTQLPNPSKPVLSDLRLLPQTLCALEQVLICAGNNWPVLLTGSASVGKAGLCRVAGSVFGSILHEYSLSSGTDSSDLIGSYEQTDKGRFVWSDSTLVSAVLEGSWVLLKHANMCPSPVLDRINSLLEPNGFLLLNEKGTAEMNVVRPHPNFRIFLTCDPKYGEVSRALRNRCVEIAVLDTFTYYDLIRLGPGMQTLPKNSVLERKPGLNSYVKWTKMAETGVELIHCWKYVFGEEDIMMETGENQTPKYINLSDTIQDPINSDFLEDFSILETVGTSPVSISFIIERSCSYDISVRLTSLGLSAHLTPILHPLFSLLKSVGFLENETWQIAVERSPNTERNPTFPVFIHWFLLSILENSASVAYLPSYLPQIWILVLYSNYSRNQFSKEKTVKTIRKLEGKDDFEVSENYGKLKDFKKKWKLMLKFVRERYKVEYPYAEVSIDGLTTVSFLNEDSDLTQFNLVQDEKDAILLRKLAWNRIKELLIPSFLTHLTLSLTDSRPFPVIPAIDSIYITSLISMFQEYREKKDSGLLRRLCFEVLRGLRRPVGAFQEFFKEAGDTSLYRLPEIWASLELMQNWPMTKVDPRLPELYFQTIKTDFFLTDQRPYYPGLHLYECYRSSPADPISCYSIEETETREHIQRLIEYKEVRSDMERWKYGGIYSSDLFTSYENAVVQFKGKQERLKTKIVRSPLPPDSAFMQHCSRLPSESRLSALVFDAESDPEKRAYAFRLFDGLIEGLESYLDICPDFALPMMEGLLLTRIGLQKTSEKQGETPFPISMESALQSQDLGLAAFVAHTVSTLPTNFSKALVHELMRIRSSIENQPNPLKLKLPKFVISYID